MALQKQKCTAYQNIVLQKDIHSNSYKYRSKINELTEIFHCRRVDNKQEIRKLTKNVYLHYSKKHRKNLTQNQDREKVNLKNKCRSWTSLESLDSVQNHYLSKTLDQIILLRVETRRANKSNHFPYSYPHSDSYVGDVVHQ